MAVPLNEFIRPARRADHMLMVDPASGVPIAGNTDATLVPSGTRTAATGQGDAVVNANGSGGVFYINVSTVSGTAPTLGVTIQGQDPVSGQWVNIGSTANITAAGLTVLSIHPSLTAAANVAIATMLPRTLRAIWAIGGTTPSFTFSVGAALVR